MGSIRVANGGGSMKALSLWQPWASLWACGRKSYETRDWSTGYRGPLLIHAAKTICTDISEELGYICEEEFGQRWPFDLPAGAMIGVCELVSCTPTQNMHVDAEERAQGNFTSGRYAWGIQNSRVFDRPIPFRGRQQLFDVPDDVIAGARHLPAAEPSPQAKLL